MRAALYRQYSRGANWLAHQMERARQANANAVFGRGSVLALDGAIENNEGNRENIRVGDHSHIRGRLLTYGHGGRISIGNWCYVGARSELWSMESISIGDRVLIAHEVNIHDGTAHSRDARERHEHFRRILETGHPRTATQLPGLASGPIVIEDDVWISFGVAILRGVRIGAGSIIAAGSIVTHDVPPGTFYQNEVRPMLRPLPIASADSSTPLTEPQ